MGVHWRGGVVRVWGVSGRGAAKVLVRVLHASVGGSYDADAHRAHVGGERADACVWSGDGIWRYGTGVVGGWVSAPVDEVVCTGAGT